MGTWGLNPKDSDGSHDKAEDIVCRSITVALIKLFKAPMECSSENCAGHLWERIGVVQILSQQHLIPLSVLKKCLKYVKTCLDDKAFINSWSHPTLFIKAARDFGSRLNKLIQKESTKKASKWRRNRGLYTEFNLINAGELAETKQWNERRNISFGIPQK